MADSKAKPNAKPADPKSPSKKPVPKPPAKADTKPAPPKPRPRPTSQSSVKLVKRTTETTGQSSNRLLDPEYLGRKLHERPGWLDEAVAVLFVVFGMVTLLSLLNTSST